MFEWLDFDSQLFGLKTARLIGAPTSLALRAAREAGAELVYGFVSEENVDALEEAAALGGRLVDRKAVFSRDLQELPARTGLLASASGPPTPGLRCLAHAAGEFSRFRRDAALPSGSFEALYSRWLERSLSRELADEVLVAGAVSEPEGFITLDDRQGIGNIGLIAVDSRSRGRGIGRALVAEALHWSAARGRSRCRVVTQLDNQAACALYRASGFSLESVTSVFHFWLERGGL